MFNFASRSRSKDSKCYVTHGTMGHLDPKQPPTKRKPYAALLAMPFVHKAELILPKELYEMIKDDLSSKFTNPIYSRVVLPLLALVEGDFFNEYIKKGNILMLSEGIHQVDNVFSLRNGILTLTLDKETYERAGIFGRPDGVKGNRGTKPRWIVEVNLRLSSMVRGRKGFDRIVYAFKNVLTNPVTWLFTDLRAQKLSPDPLGKHFPILTSCHPTISEPVMVETPQLQPPNEQKDKFEDEFGNFVVDIYEWLSLIYLESPRIDFNDHIDPFLSRYISPKPESLHTETSELVKIAWQGFISPIWAHKIFVEIVLAATAKMWFSYTVSGFSEKIPDGTKDCTILKLPGFRTEYILWEIEE